MSHARPDDSFLRKRAEKQPTVEALPATVASSPESEARRRLREFQVYQVELEMQNEGLRHAHDQVEESRRRYRDLYDFSPLGYFTLDGDGIVLEANLTGCHLIGADREGLVGAHFADFIAPADGSLFCSFYRQIIQGGGRGSCEATILRTSGTGLPVKIEGVRQQDPERGALVCRIAVTDVSELRQALDQIRKLNQELEGRVEERTQGLLAANRELEAFCYSVSHDLRTPLRAIDGFSQALLDDWSPHLDGRAQDYLGRIRAASQRMAELIDDLLELSRLTRRQMQSMDVDLTGLAHALGADIRAAQPDRRVDFRVAPGLTARGDPHLLRIALQNLLENAWKFTVRRPQACIYFGATLHHGQPAFYVRDNGAGFNMAYADKLFGAFQRLHAASEFCGTGIGLATVQRVIHRHGGQIWAEGREDRGARFYFTLPGARADGPARLFEQNLAASRRN